MSSRHGARLAALVAPLALLAPAVAHADSISVDDASGDVKALNVGALFGELLNGVPVEGPFLLEAPAETSTDVVRTTVDHARKRLTLTFQFRDLVEVEGHSATIRIRTSSGRYDLVVGRAGGTTIADLVPSGGFMVTEDGDGDVTLPKACRTVRARYDVAADTLTTSAPTSCLGSPRWVQVSATASRTKITPQADGSANFAAWADDAFRSRLSENSMGRSPKVRRG